MLVDGVDAHLGTVGVLHGHIPGAGPVVTDQDGAEAHVDAGARRRATRSVTSARILAASASPSSTLAVMCSLVIVVPRQCRSVSAAWSVPEVALATGRHHGDAGFVGCRDDLAVPDRAAGLDDRRHSGVGQHQQAVGEGEERITGRRATPGP